MKTATNKKFDVYEMVTNQIVSLLEAGTVPWHRPWAEARAPFNLVTKRPYRGINCLLLGLLNYEIPAFLTFKQITAMKASVRKGEKGHRVVFYKTLIREEAGKEPKKTYYLQYFTVFNVGQCVNIPTGKLPGPMNPFEPEEACEEILHRMPKLPRIEHGGNEASYDPLLDCIQLPPMQQFDDADGYYSTVFHEVVHSTGHECRLGRDEVISATAVYGSNDYSFEELVAELGASYLRGITGITAGGYANSAAYINGWLKVLRSDKRILLRAASQAQRAVDYILGIEVSEEKGVHHENAQA